MRIESADGYRASEDMLSIVKRATSKRLDRLRKLMEDRGLSTLILFENDPIAYRISLTRHFNAVVITESHVHVLTDPTLYDEARRESPWSVVLVKDFSLEGLLKALSRISSISKGMKMGIDKAWGRNKLSYLYADLLETLRVRGVEIVDATPILEEVFDKPFDEELRIVEWISEISSQALEAAYEHLRPGIRECELASLVDRVLNENGIIDRWFQTMVVSGPRAATPHAKTSTRRIGYGEPVIIDVGPLWMGYDGCVAHTFIAGQSRYWENILEEIIKTMKIGLDHAKPGTPVRVLDEVPRNELKKRGYPDYPHLTGHPVGGFYKPIIAEFVDYTLETNMVFAYEPAIYIPNKGGVRIEPHILITNNGYAILTKIHRELLTS